MSREPVYDAGSKWLLEKQGRSLALLGGFRDVVSFEALAPEMAHTRQTPDGLLKLRRRGKKEPTLLLVEFCTHPESRVPRQIADDIMLVLQSRGVLPEVLALVLCPRGKTEVPSGYTVASESGVAKASFEWEVRNLWEMDAERMLAEGGVGVVPWAVLMKFDGPPEPFLRRCRERIDNEGAGQVQDLLAVAHSFTRLRYDAPELLELFGGRRAMIEFPWVKEYGQEQMCAGRREDIEAVVRLRFSALPDDARARLAGVAELDRLTALHEFAVLCRDKGAFVARLVEETTTPPRPASSRRKPKAKE
jgi:hypothetical protein